MAASDKSGSLLSVVQRDGSFVSCRSLGAAWLWVALAGCASAADPQSSESELNSGRRTAAIVLPPTPNGVDAPVMGPAQLATRSRAAFDGENFLVVWQDERGAETGVFAARMGKNGELLDPDNVIVPTIGQGRSPSVAYGDADFLVVWQERRGDFSSYRIAGLRIGRDGRTIGTPFAISVDPPFDDCQHPAVAFDGTNYLVIWNYSPSSTNRIEGARVSPSGTVLDSPPTTLVSTEVSGDPVTSPGLVFGGGNYLVGWAEGGKIFASRFSSTLARLDTPGVELATGTTSFNPELAWDGTRYWAGFNAFNASSSTSSPMARRMSAAGAALGDVETIATDASNAYPVPAIVADSTGALTAFSRGGSDAEDLLGGLLDPASGTLTDTRSLVATGGSQWGPAFSPGNATTPFLLTWSDTRHAGSAIYASRLGTDRAALDGTGTLVSRAANTQLGPAVAASASGFLVAWIDSREGGFQVYGTDLDGTGAPKRATARAFASGRPRRMNVALASDGAKYLAVWNENAFTSDNPAVARIIASDGVAETAPVVLDAGRALYDPVAAFGGGNYLVIGSRSVSGTWPLSGVRVSPSGQLLDATPFPITADAFRPAMASNGTDFLVVWRAGSAIHALRLDADGAPRESSPFTINVAGGTVGSYPKVAFGEDAYLVVWRNLTPSSIFAARVNAAGTVLDTTPITVVPQGTPPRVEIPTDPSVSFDGSRFMVAWRSDVLEGGNFLSEDFKVTPVTSEGVVGRAERVGPRDDSNGVTEGAAIAATPMGTTVVAYTERDDSPGYAIERVRIRSFSTEGKPPGGACTTRADCAAGECVDGVCCESACGGGPLDCQACSVIAGAPTNGVCAPLDDDHPCGQAGTCSDGACVEPPDAGSPGSGGAEGADASSGDSGASQDGGALGSGGVPSDGSAPSNADGGPTAVGGTSGNAGKGSTGATSSNGGVFSSGSGGVTSNDRDAMSSPDGGDVATRGGDSGGCGCRTAGTARRNSVTWLLVVAAMVVGGNTRRRGSASGREGRFGYRRKAA